MNYYICPECGQKYCGWASTIICRVCKVRLKKITREEFYSEEVVTEKVKKS